jgi:hypothetical protein
MSNLWELNLKDWLNGLIFAVIADIIAYLMIVFGNLYQLVINKQPFVLEINWQALVIIAVFSALTYLSKRFVSGPTGTLLKK